MEVKTLKNNYAYSEVIKIIDNMEVKYKEMLLQKLIDFLNENKNFEYQKHINPRTTLSKQNISKDANSILAMINLKYWVKDEEHKTSLLNRYKANDDSLMNIENNYLFKNNIDKKTENITNANKELVVIKKENIFIRIINFLKSIGK